MPELPEVETTRRGIAPYITGRCITGVVVRNPALRWPVPPGIGRQLRGQEVRQVGRRAKYLLLALDRGWLILHLGMSGSLRLVTDHAAPTRHDHLDIAFGPDLILRLRDPRRFGSMHYTREDPERHKLLRRLGPEPLGEGFTADYLYGRSRGRKQAVKNFIMDSHVVAGVGNIYASEALYASGIHPGRAAGRIGLPRYQRLAEAVRAVLQSSILKGGTSLRDFLAGDGRPGYFRQELQVYERAGRPCPACSAIIRQIRIGQRSSYYCPVCQR